jgi:SAM-dependent methyltransferase
VTDGAQHIRDAYARRDTSKGDRYEWYQRDLGDRIRQRNAALIDVLHQTVGSSLSSATALDVGCGDGRLARFLIDLGVDPANVRGVDLLEDRIRDARLRTAAAAEFEARDLLESPLEEEFDLVFAFTLLSSITDGTMQGRMLDSLWRCVRPGGWLVVFDFRFNNPRNSDVVRIHPRDIIKRLRPDSVLTRTLCVPPPIARTVGRFMCGFDRFVVRVLPFLRSHVLLALQRPGHG